MDKIYVCKIDNIKFVSKKELLEHLLNNYVLEDTSDGIINNALKKLTDSFPFAVIKIKKINENLIQVDMRWEEYNSDFSFTIGDRVNDKNGSYDYCTSINFKTLEEAIKNYQYFIDKKNEIIGKLDACFHPDSIIINQIYEDEYGNNCSSIDFEIDKNKEMYRETYEFGDINEFIDLFKGNFINVIDGNITSRSTYSGEEYFIGNVSVNTMLNRAKKARLELLD